MKLQMDAAICAHFQQ